MPDRVADGIRSRRVHQLRDAGGRPVAEIGSDHWDPATTEIVACPYRDGRRGRPMNLSALRQLASVWPEALAIVRTLAGPRPTVHRVWKVALVGVTAPLVLSEPIPLVWSALYKASLGLSQITTHLLLAADGVADATFGELGDGEAFFEALDQGEWLLGQVQVCAGTRTMLVELAVALSRPGPIAEVPDEIAALGDLAAEVVAVDAVRALRTPGNADLAPWLRSLVSVPDRPVVEVRRLFPTGRVPAVVEAMIAGGG